jgi:hypothetical protein
LTFYNLFLLFFLIFKNYCELNDSKIIIISSSRINQFKEILDSFYTKLS